MRNSFLNDFYKVNPSLDPAKQPEKKPADNDENSLREAMEDFKAGFDAMKHELADVRKELSNKNQQQAQPADADDTSNVDNNEGGADNAS